MILKECATCGVEFRAKESVQKYCGRSCYYKSRGSGSESRAHDHTCGQCGKHFQGRSKRRFCSPTCAADASRKRHVDPRPCELCGTVFSPRAKLVEQRFCSKKCAAKACAPRGENHYSYRGDVVTTTAGYLRRAGVWTLVHQEVWWAANPDGVCEDCGGTVRHVHHINEIKTDNRLENLAGLCTKCHGARHRKPKPDCSVDGCDREIRSSGYCSKHYKRWKANGDPMIVLRGNKHGKRPVWVA